LSLRLVEEMLLERGIVVSYETIRRWAIKFGADYARRLKRKAPSRLDIWHLDEVVITINGDKRYLWRAVDQEGYVLDEIVQIYRDTKAARRLLMRPRLIQRRQTRDHAEYRASAAQGVEQSRGEFSRSRPKTGADDAGFSIMVGIARLA
jgi:putative transposase